MYIINYSPSCRSKLVRPSFIFGTQIKIFLMNSESSLILFIDHKVSYMIKAQKRSKEIVKIIHVTSVVQSKYFEVTRILFVRKRKKNYFIQQFISSASLYSIVLECITFINNVCCSVSAAMYADTLFTLFTL